MSSCMLCAGSDTAQLPALPKVTMTVKGKQFEWPEHIKTTRTVRLNMPWKEDSGTASEGARSDGGNVLAQREIILQIINDKVSGT